MSQHRAGWQKQANKTHKTTKRSKRSLDRLNGGRVMDGAMGVGTGGGGGAAGSVFSTSSASTLGGRVARANRAAMLRKNKRQATLLAKRQGGSSTGHRAGGAPRTVGIVHLSPRGTVPIVLGENGVGALKSGGDMFTEIFPNEKFRSTFVLAARSTLSVLDVAKVSDILCFVLPLSVPEAQHSQVSAASSKRGGTLELYLGDSIDEEGRKFVSLAKAQGLPTVVGILQNLEHVPAKHRSAIKKQAANFFQEEFGSSTKMVVDAPPDALEGEDAPMAMDETASVISTLPKSGPIATARTHFVRALMESKLKRIAWRSERSYMLGYKSSYEAASQTLKVSGYLRGRPLDVHQLVHVVGHGTYQLAQIEAARDPFPERAHRADALESDAAMAEDGSAALAVADPALTPSLQEEATPDLLAGEQTWPTNEEMEDAEPDAQDLEARKLEKQRRALKNKGASDYQAAWLLGMSDDEDEEGDDADEDEEDGLDEDLDEAEKGLTLAEWKRKHLKDKEQEELDFPDEVDTPEDISAKERFAKYRGLKSFRTSPWHPKESLPQEYARIFQIENSKALENQVLRDGEDLEQAWLVASLSHNAGRVGKDGPLKGLIFPGTFVTLCIKGVDSDLATAAREEGLPLVVGALLKNEQKLSVMNCNIQKNPEYEEPVKARSELVMSCGLWRRKVRPAFSENTVNCDKHKFERFLHAGRWSVATVYAPLTFGSNVPVVLLDSQANEMVASGSVLDMNPDRIILKKICLSGHPIRVKKSWAVVRYMFFTPEDVRWFKPVDLWTKYGMSGRITMPLGTHGLFKCSFSKPIKNHDTVMMSLYKRVFPKPVEEFKDLQEQQRRDAAAADESLASMEA
ncbi:Pre-rRNA-processing protein TSR1-like [Hondaea fermentalgiana]|uniref:Pre-rRNA-processing protein TSR1-like n=1 Tax=Hondaea fermentalgiana TaxID=2315210 RepID=A0A2R5GC37_9STRA|nr:Pre-rRNA-processing protein TSR1-like [Hondaea fermentalgiana]|eukprot:GBG27889.1 Pre-rRNA-processing protein TSR1-like [Hondaea fermentalgiana]